ncbi:hypothetical protein Cni_G12142 [Canna indica]|uniref:Uncharacterized protein n=1 Tax=Canna indica TaxID=4628 RepID=A0AAQ3KBC7_9LILI|nr:hypothetical protein Cni_G12142 [Canna indica]
MKVLRGHAHLIRMIKLRASPSRSLMKKPNNNSMANSVCPRELSSPSQDSSWASHMADFLVATAQMDQESTCRGSSSVVGEKSSSKKRKTRAIKMDDDPLEDTACSSPVKLPKVERLSADISQTKPRKKNMTWRTCDEIDVRTETPKDSCGLRKKGLCLVPLSVVMDFVDRVATL